MSQVWDSYTYTPLCTNIYTYICIYVLIYIHIHMHGHPSIHKHIYTSTPVNTNTHIKIKKKMFSLFLIYDFLKLFLSEESFIFNDDFH